MNAESQLGVEGERARVQVRCRLHPEPVRVRSKKAQPRHLGRLPHDGRDRLRRRRQFPDSTFAIIDSAFDPPIRNAQGLLFKEQEAGCLVGRRRCADVEDGHHLVGRAARRSRPSIASSPATSTARSRYEARTSSCSTAYSQDFVDQAKCKEIALDQISKGSDVVFQVAGGCGLGALDAAKQKGVWGIGVDADQSFLGDHILTERREARRRGRLQDDRESVQDGTFTAAA